jgi:hypothetical protein
MTQDPLTDYQEFHRRWPKVMAMASGTAVLPIVGSAAAHWTDFRPIWPGLVPQVFLVGSTSFLVAAYCYHFASGKTLARRSIRRSIFYFVAAIALYALLNSLLIVTVEGEHRYARGIYTEEAKRVRKEKPNITDAEMLAQAGGGADLDADAVFVWWTSAAVRWLLLAIWVFAFVSFARFSASTVLVLRAH